ncbi:expressed unknown protein [Seminavis robusta]|uniref:Uncharacterized protein n=1 Tax=Seminavis robusta TaxID=568900 RepID=A0A9N8EI72_9STRA|nr:expressed unknown protein [Seminavis robusta]|eukprot:Sro1040_g234481.1  (116) ;mRNA; f:32646-32993
MEEIHLDSKWWNVVVVSSRIGVDVPQQNCAHAIAMCNMSPGWECGDFQNFVNVLTCPYPWSSKRWNRPAPPRKSGPYKTSREVFLLYPILAVMAWCDWAWILLSSLKVKWHIGRA